ncbi:CPA2 family monovalent cation:H+ antiporter-2 [Dokdonella fugitiva]|uniref:CPA2 family monovalent cation:H+ antiporter-2 n=1 Tax=Dokdonella fugitiva TaxID=328517 RepID=A0A839EXP1_9GAMM|nr:YbaL family putative K(+) efflux transporter [Dokdonella fugitiva]MBA8889467.1 CPA2 family monovalent cation:H+ antiporter-2 [Dokdonella fugitiva]
MPHSTPLIATLVSAFVLAYVAGMLAQRLRLPPIVGYLLAGVAIGPFTPGIVADQALAPELSEIGVILLMFGVGLHFSLGDLLAVRAIALPGAAVQIAIATALGMLLAWAIGWSAGSGLVLGLALSTASTVVLLRALEERGLLETQRGRIAIGWLIVEDLAMVLTLVLLPALAGLLGGTAQEGVNLYAALGLTLAKVAAFVAVMLVVGRRAIPWLLERTAGTGSRELFTLAVLGIALGVAYASAMLFGVSFALGAFFAGMVLNESKLSHQAAQESLPFRDAFAVLFFVSVGMLFDPSILVRAPLPVLGVLAIILVGKSIGAFAIVRAFGRPAEVGLTIATSLAQIGEFAFILAGLGIELGLLPKDGRDLVLAGAILSICANPLLFVALDRWLARRDAAAAAAAPREPDLPPGPPLPERDHVILVGFGRVGSLVGQRLHDEGTPLALIEPDADAVERARALGIPALAGNAAAAERLAAVHVAGARAIVVAIPQALEAGQIIRHAREANPAIAVLARAHSDDEVAYLLGCGADAAVMGEREIARSMCESIDGLARWFQPRAAAPAAPDAA